MARINKILDTVIAVGDGNAVSGYQPGKSFQAVLSGTGTFSATVKIQVSIDKITWFDKSTLSLTQAILSLPFYLEEVWPYIRGSVPAITGTAATVNLFMAS